MAENSNLNLIKLLKKVERQDPENALLAELYKRHSKKTIEDLVTDLRQDASNTIGRIFTGAVDYDECVKRVAQKVGVKARFLTGDEAQNELLLLQILLKTHFEKLSPVEREAKIEEITKEFGVQGKDVITAVLLGTSSAFLGLIQQMGPLVVRQILFRVFMTFVSVQTAFTIVRFAALAIPFVNAVMAAWLAFDIAGPAYRKIVPSVLNIALLRLSYTEKDDAV
jgi:uncharacterized protein YaaW (UPF0174 family)